MRFQRRFTIEGQSPYEGITFVPRTSRIAKLDGTVVFEAQDVMVPDFWDQTAVDILAQKYFRRRGCDFKHEGSVYRHPFARKIFPAGYEIPTHVGENDLRETIHRIVGCWTHWGSRYGYFDTAADAQAFYDELSYMLAMQMFAPNSPQWFNTGLHFAYGIEGDAQGHYYVDPDGEEPTPMGWELGLRRSTNAYEHPQTSACFIQSVSDDLVNEGGIMDLWVREARLFKYGSGSGSNYYNNHG
jgi:ribonucleoside-diphosphate reductase alpha chain